MEDSKWKLAVNIVASFYLFCCLFGLCMTGKTVLKALRTPAEDPANCDNFYSWQTYEFRWLIELSVTCICIIIWASMQLLQALVKETDEKIVLQKAKIWRNISLVFLPVEFILAFPEPEPGVIHIVGILLSGVSIFIVCKFIGTLEDGKLNFLERTVGQVPETEKNLIAGISLIIDQSYRQP